MELDSPDVILSRSKRKRTSSNESQDPLKRAKVDEEIVSEDENVDDYTDRSSPSDDRDSSSKSSVPSVQANTPRSKEPREKRYACDFPDCGKAFSRPVRLAEHQRSHTNDRPFVCSHGGCDKAFLRDSHLKHHVKSVHENRRDWVCDWPGCDKAFATGQRMRNHRKTHDDKEQCKCTKCGQYFRKQETLQRHIVAVHMQDKPYICDHMNEGTGVVCGRKFKQSQQMIGHQNREHSGIRFWCTLCSTDAMHVDPVMTPEGPPAGQVGFRTHGEYQQHVKEVHPPTCEECGHVCQTTHQLKAHIEIQHESIDKRRNFPCTYPDCGKAFTKKGNLNVHVRAVHDKKKEFVCGQVELKVSKTFPGWDGHGACGRHFGSKKGLENHIITQHLLLPGITGDGNAKAKAKRIQDDQDDQSPATNTPNSTMLPTATKRLTGKAFDDRELACTVVPCPSRFMRTYDLEVHLELVHGMTSLAAMEAAVEQEALSGGQFWIGGSEDEDEDDEALLARRLDQALYADGTY